MTDEIINKVNEEHEHHHHHHDHDDDCCGHDHDHDHEHHHHDHDDDCCGGHDHHDHEHHHHDHDDDCCCGHDHDHDYHDHHHHHDHDHEHHHHHDEKIEISTHEDATIATVRMDLGTDRHAAEAQLKSFMRAVAEGSEAAGGMVGHIKFFLKESQGRMLSMTDLEEIQEKPAAAAKFTAEGVAIILSIDPEDLEEIVKLHYPGAV